MRVGEALTLAATFVIVFASMSVFVLLYDIRMKQLNKVLNKQYEVLSEMLTGFRSEMQAARDVFQAVLEKDRRKFHETYQELVGKSINTEQAALKLFGQVKAWKTPPDLAEARA